MWFCMFGLITYFNAAMWFSFTCCFLACGAWFVMIDAVGCRLCLCFLFVLFCVVVWFGLLVCNSVVW